MARAASQRGYLSRLAEPLPAGAAAVKVVHSDRAPNWRALVPEIQDETDGTMVSSPAPQTSEGKQGAEPEFRAFRPQSPSLVDAPKAAAAAGVLSQSQQHREPSLLNQTKTESPALSLGSIPARMPEVPLSKPSVRSSDLSAASAPGGPPIAPRTLLKADEASTLHEIKPSLVAASGSSLKGVAAPASGFIGQTLAAPEAVEFLSSSPNRSLKRPQSSSGGPSDPLLLPLTAQLKPATEPKPKGRLSPRVHIGKLEIRMITPAPKVAPLQAAGPIQTQRAIPPAPAAPSHDLARELAWSYGLVQG